MGCARWCMGDFVLHLSILVRLAGALDRFLWCREGCWMQTRSFFPMREADICCVQYYEKMYQMKWLVCCDSTSVTTIEPAGAERRFQCRACVDDGWVAGFDRSVVCEPTES